MADTEKEVLESEISENSLSEALASLSLTTELDSALLNHLNLMDQYLFHMECLSQLLRMVRKIESKVF